MQNTILVFTNPRAGLSDKDFDAWYDDVHAPELVETVPGIVRIRRFALAGPPSGTHRRLAIFELGRPAAEVMASLAKRAPDYGMLDVEVAPPMLVAYDQISSIGR